MTETFELKAEKREATGRRKVSDLRKNKQIPAVLYGSGIETQSIQVEKGVFIKLYDQAGESSLVDLTINGDQPAKVIIHSIQRDALSDEITHVDFLQVRMDEKITAEIELTFTGIAPAEKNLGGILIKNITELEVECLPGNLPSEIEIDLTSLETFDDHIRVKDIKLPDSVKFTIDAEQTIVSVSEPRSEEELKSLEEDVVVDVEAVGDTEQTEKADEEEDKESDDKKES